MFDAVLRGWGGEFAVTRYDEHTDAFVFIAVHSTRLGPAAGGTRIKGYPTPAEGLADACRLAEAMTLKMAVAGLPMGGGKAVICLPFEAGGLSAADRSHVLRLQGETIQRLRGSYWTGPDLNTSSADMDVLREHTGHVFGASPQRGGSGTSGPDTAIGVWHGIRASLEHQDGSPDLTGRRVLVQGVGAVGGVLVRLLHEAGAHVIVADLNFAKVEELYESLDVEVVAPASALETDCDVFAPCGSGGVLGPETISRLRCRIIAGAANNPLSAREDADLLRERGILYAPDFVINAGGAIHLIGYEALGWTAEQVADHLRGIGTTLSEIYVRADKDGISTELAAEQLAASRLAGA